MNALEKAAALHAEHHHTKYDPHEVYAWQIAAPKSDHIPANEPKTQKTPAPFHRPGWDDAKQAKLDEALKIVENWR